MGPELSDLQERLFAERTTGSTRNVLLVLQGMDTSGKGGVLRHTVGLIDPQGVRITSFKAPTDEEKQHDFLWRIRNALPGAGRRRRLRPLALRGRADRPRARVGRRGRDRAPLRRDQRLRGRAGRRRHDDRQVHAAHLGRRAEGAAAGPARGPDQALEVQPRRPRRARAVAGLPRGLRDRPGAHQHRGGALARHPERQEVVPQPGHRAPAPRGAAGAWTCSGRWPTSTSRRRSSGWPTRPRSRDPHRRRHPLRHPAARGRLAARPRRGRRPRHLRLQVPRRRPGRPGAGGRGDRRRSWPAGSGCARPGWWPSTSTPRSPATRPTRRSRTCSTPAPGSTSASTSCPARSATTARPAPTRRRRPGCCGWTPSRANVDRSWRNPNLLLWHGDLWVIDHGACLYFHHGWAGGVGDPRALRVAALGPGRPRPAHGGPRAARGGRRGAPASSAARRSPRCSPRCRTPGSSRCPGAESPDGPAGGVRRLPGRAAGAAPVAPRGWPDDRAALPVRRAPLRPARRPRGVRQRRRGALLRGDAASSRLAWQRRPRAAARAGPDARPRRGVRRAGVRRRRVRGRRARRRGRPRSRWAAGSASSRRRAAR